MVGDIQYDRACSVGFIALTSQVAPPTPIDIPPLRIWTFIPVTGQIISRQVIVQDGTKVVATHAKPKPKASPETAEAKESKELPGSGSTSGNKLPTVTKPKGSVITPGGEDVKNEDDDDPQEEAEEEATESGVGNIEEELKKLEALQKQSRKQKGDGEPAKKKPRKAKE